MIVDFEKIRSDVLAELENEFPPEEQRTGAEKLAHAYDPQIVLVCCKVLMKYHEGWFKFMELCEDPGSFKNYGHYDPGIRDIFLRWRKRPVFPRFLGTGAYKLGSVDQFRHSLELAAVRDFQIKKNQFDSAKASFCMLNGTRHNYFSVTDLDYHLKNDENVLNIGRAYIVASIPTSPFFHGEVNLGYFIFVASIFPVEDKPQLNL